MQATHTYLAGIPEGINPSTLFKYVQEQTLTNMYPEYAGQNKHEYHHRKVSFNSPYSGKEKGKLSGIGLTH